MVRVEPTPSPPIPARQFCFSGKPLVGLEILHQIHYSIEDLVGEGYAIPSVRKGDDVVKLTVLYNLPEGADHDEFLRRRSTTHQQSNASMPGVMKTDFYVASETPMGGAAIPLHHRGILRDDGGPGDGVLQ
jgi:hypothetical protein